MGSILLDFQCNTILLGGVAWWSHDHKVNIFRHIDVAAQFDISHFHYCSYVLMLEVTGAEWHELLVALYQIPLYLGQLLMPLFAYHHPHWRNLQFAMSIPSVIIVLYCLRLAESPRWLLTTRRTSAATALMLKAAKCNRMPTETIASDVECYTADVNEDSNIQFNNLIDMFCRPSTRKNTICIGLSWFLIGFTYTSVQHIIWDYYEDIFWKLAIDILYQFPGIVYCAYAAIPFGLRNILIISNIISCICMMITLVNSIANIELAVVALTAAAASSIAMYTITIKTSPTCVRAVCLALAFTMGQFGFYLASIVVVLLISDHSRILSILLGFTSFLTVNIVMLMPETTRHPLPDTVDDAERLLLYCDCE